MEIFQSKLEEAENISSMKEDCRRERWRNQCIQIKHKEIKTVEGQTW